MITLSIILTIWGIISIYRLNRIAKKNKSSFNPYEGTIIDAFGFYVGIFIMGFWIVFLTIHYMP